MTFVSVNRKIGGGGHNKRNLMEKNKISENTSPPTIGNETISIPNKIKTFFHMMILTIIISSNNNHIMLK